MSSNPLRRDRKLVHLPLIGLAGLFATFGAVFAFAVLIGRVA